MTQSDWIATAVLVTPVASRATAAALFASASGNPADAAPNSFSVPVCASGGGPITHYACLTRLRGSTLAALPQLAAHVAGSIWVLTQHDEDSDALAAQRPTLDDALAAYGLERYTPPDEDL